MRVFIDTNIFLNFYRISSKETFSVYEKILDAIRAKQVEVLIPYQLEREFLRQKHWVVIAFKKTQEEVLKQDNIFGIATFLKNTDEGKKLELARNEFREKQKELLDAYLKYVVDPSSKVNQFVDKVFKAGVAVPETKDIIERAHRRYLRGDPPRKRGQDESLGDAIMWESLLEKFTDQDLYIVTGDGDWYDALEEKQVNPLMQKEWMDASGGKTTVTRYAFLSEFVKERLGAKDEATEEALKEEKASISTEARVFPLNIDLVSGSGFSTSSTITSASSFYPWVDNTAFSAVAFSICVRCGGRYVPSPTSVLVSLCNDCEVDT